MNSLFHSTKNTRSLPTGDYRYIRSDVPTSLTDSEIRWLREHDVTTVVDLREEKEVSKAPCPLASMDDFNYVTLPVTGGGDTPKSLEHLKIVYSQMVDEQMEIIVDTIMNAKTNVLYFCTAGKDRTGVVSAIILKRLGFDDDIIIDDYMKSKENLMDMLVSYVKIHPEVDLEIIIPHRENLEAILANDCRNKT